MPYDKRRSSFAFGEAPGDRANAGKDMRVLPKSDAAELARYPFAVLVVGDGSLSVVPEEAESDAAISLGNVTAGTVIPCGVRRVTAGSTATVVGIFPEQVEGSL